MELDDEQEVIDCLHATRRALMNLDLKVILESEGLCFKVLTLKDYVIVIRWTHAMIDDAVYDDEGLAMILYQIVRNVTSKD